MKNIMPIIVVIIVIVALLGVSGALYTIDETQQVVITQFGKPIGDPITKAGLHFKIPVMRQANYFRKWIWEWDGDPKSIPTKDGKYIWVDTTARWKIVDALKFMQTVRNEREAFSRLDDKIRSATKGIITSNNLTEIVRNSNRIIDEKVLSPDDAISGERTTGFEAIKLGREKITRDIFKKAAEEVSQFGIKLVDVRIKGIKYTEDVQKEVYERMISERKRAAEQYRSEGQGKKAEIDGQRGKELNQIRSEAYKVAAKLKGKADAEAIDIYANAYNRDPEFYSFLKTLDVYKTTIDEKTTVILTTDSEYLQYLKNTIAGSE